MINRKDFGKVFRISKETQQRHDELVAAQQKAYKSYERAGKKVSNFIQKNTPSGATYHSTNVMTDEHYLVLNTYGIY